MVFCVSQSKPKFLGTKKFYKFQRNVFSSKLTGDCETVLVMLKNLLSSLKMYKKTKVCIALAHAIGALKNLK